MYYTDDSILPENMAPLIITAAPYGPEWLPGDADIPVTWDEQVQAAVDCYTQAPPCSTCMCVIRPLAMDQWTSNNSTTSLGGSRRPSPR